MAHKRFFYGNFDNIFRLFCRPSPNGGVLADANIVTVLKIIKVNSVTVLIMIS